ncbi:hypothetical protein KFK09_003843 [Dendrobium nobile]|uniref:CCHC-type domain-containing protein n=1 Tax=Dendrobium nobile TaxID=94219 RepID=A0A8T3C188_DENNO|nr:hypothetical protein KFK09_003843 [Dendrobium nobile]
MRPPSRLPVVEGKGKKAIVEDESIMSNGKLVVSGMLNLDPMNSVDEFLKGCKSFETSGMNEDRCGDYSLKIGNGQERDIALDYVKYSGMGSTIDRLVMEDTNKQESLNEDFKAWTKPKHIKINLKKEKVELSEDGVAVKLNLKIEEKNKHVLRHSVWSKYGGFHLTSIGMDWILCSFRTEEAMEEILNGGMWFVGGHIFGMDQWTSAFDPYSFKGVSAPIWIRFPCLPLYYWDEDNIVRIASRFGTPMYIDGNTFRWGKREFARVCVKIDLEKKLPNGVWVEGSAGRYFQRVEYEKVDLFCYHCGRAGHNKTECPEEVVQGITDQAIMKYVADESRNIILEANPSVIKLEYGPWIHVQFKIKRFVKANGSGRNMNERQNNRIDNMGTKFEKKVISAEMNNVDNVSTPGLVEDPVNNNEEVDKSKDLATHCIEENIGAGDTRVKLNDSDLKYVDVGSQCGGYKIKLAKELRSLGPLETGHKKKRRDRRGAKKREAALYLKEMVREQDVCFIGGMLVLWDKKSVSFVVKNTSTQVIIGDLLIPSLGLWKIVTVYRSRCCKQREDLWRQREKGLKEPNPSIIGGDFNCILNKEKKRGGKRFLFSKGPRDMKQFMTNSDFHDVRSIGPRYTWCNNKEGASQIWERLDRCLVNLVALQKIPSALTRHLARVASDLSPIAFKLDERECSKMKNIKFEDTWRSYPAARSIVYHSWKKNDFGEELKKDILELQNKEVVGIDWTNEDLLFLRSKVHELNVTLNRLATWWNQRAKERWHEEGDINSKVFHNFATDFIHFLEAKWQSRTCELTGWPMVSENQKLSQRDAADLCSDSLWMNYRFRYFNRETIDLQKCISKLITEEQMAFMSGRSISEHCLLAQEIFHKFKISKNKKGLMALKLDMEQAYDSMGWPALDQILKWYGFPCLFSKLLMECVVGVRFSIIINGRNSEWIDAHSGFRQGCPLSPYLFIMCFQLVSNSIKQKGQDLGIRFSPRGPRITHLLYADDVLIFSHVSIGLALAFKKIVEDFCKWTGQRINVSKSQIFFLELRRLSSQNLGIVKIYCTIAYLSWRNRNYVKHGKSTLPSFVIASNALALANNKDSPYLSNWGTNLLRESRESWCPPPKDWMKINVDASLLRSNCAGVGGIFRDHKGRFILAFGEKKAHWDITKLEMEVVFSVRKYIRSWMLEYKGVIIESDNLNVIKFIQDAFKKNKGIVDRWPLEELPFVNDFHKVVYNHVHRSCNKVANLCATMALSRSFFFDSFSFGNIPSLLLYSIKKEGDSFHSYQGQPTKDKGKEKAKYKKGKMKTQKAFWADSASESSEEEAEEEVTNLCLMANDNLDELDQDEFFSLTPSSLTPSLSLLALLTMSGSNKRGRLVAGSSSSSSYPRGRFLNTKNEEAYHRYKACEITLSKMLNQADQNFEMPLFVFFSIGDTSLKNLSLMKKKEKMPQPQLKYVHDDMQNPEHLHQHTLTIIWLNASTNFRLISILTFKSNINNTRLTCNVFAPLSGAVKRGRRLL